MSQANLKIELGIGTDTDTDTGHVTPNCGCGFAALCNLRLFPNSLPRFPQHRSRIRAIPWPTPMHMVQRA